MGAPSEHVAHTTKPGKIRFNGHKRQPRTSKKTLQSVRNFLGQVGIQK